MQRAIPAPLRTPAMAKIIILLLAIVAIALLALYGVYRYSLHKKKMEHEKQMKREERDYEMLMEDMEENDR